MKVQYCGTLLALLTGCGSGTSTPAPTPVVTPTPAPTPTPTPTAATYQTAFDFTRDRTFTGLVTATNALTSPTRVVYGGQDSQAIVYTAATASITKFGQTLTPGVMETTLLRTGDSLTYSYRIGTSGATFTVFRGSADAIYVSYARDVQRTPTLGTLILALFGSLTRTSDLPVTGIKSYQLTVAEIGTATAGQTLTIDATTRRLIGTVGITLTGATTPINVVIQGSIDAQTGRIEGTAATADGTYAGTLRGLSYGPASAEIGLIFNLIDRSGNDTAGVILGRAG